MRIVSYAINGRGMGHLVRQLAILRWVRRYAAVLGQRAECWLLTSSEADTLARREGIPALKIPSKSMMRDAGLEPARYLAIARTWVVNAIGTLQPDVLVVDTFPGGSFGELVPVLEMARKRVLVARRVRGEMEQDAAWQALLPLYDRVIVPDEDGVGPILLREREELADRAAARSALGVPEGRKVAWLTLGGGGDRAASTALPRLVGPVRAAGWHVVVAAGPLYAGTEVRGEGVTWLDRYASMELCTGADVAVSAGGYNSLHELLYVGVPTVFLPQPRLADDQAARVRRAVDAGAGLLAGTLDEVPALLARLPERVAPFVQQNGARDAAVAVLSLAADPADVEAARAAWSPDTLRALRSASIDAEGAVALIRLFSGTVPSVHAKRRAVLAELGLPADGTPAAAATDAVARFLRACADVRLEPSHALPLAQTLARRFPAARPGELLDACERLFVAFARWDDWMGALALLRALPPQREYALSQLADELPRWIDGAPDPYEALKRFHALAGDRPLAEVLRMRG